MTFTVRQMEIASTLKTERAVPGLTPIELPLCEADRRGGKGQCTRPATHRTDDGKLLCFNHAVAWAEGRN